MKYFVLIFAFGMISALALLNACAAKPSPDSSAVILTAPLDFNARILEIIRQMPERGGYSTHGGAWQALQKSISIENDQIKVDPSLAHPSFCSSATYLVFIDLISQLQKEGRLQLSAEDLQQLKVLNPEQQEDGAGIWGRWNANGPGTARLFWQMGLGPNFTEKDFAKARPGDFLKIYWNDEIGAKEQGHSVIFTGAKANGGVCFWSSNTVFPGEKTTGMGEKCVDEAKIHRMVFSRLEFPERLKLAAQIFAGDKYKDSYLQQLQKRSSSVSEMDQMIGCKTNGDCL